MTVVSKMRESFDYLPFHDARPLFAETYYLYRELEGFLLRAGNLGMYEDGVLESLFSTWAKYREWTEK